MNVSTGFETCPFAGLATSGNDAEDGFERALDADGRDVDDEEDEEKQSATNGLLNLRDLPAGFATFSCAIDMALCV